MDIAQNEFIPLKSSDWPPGKKNRNYLTSSDPHHDISKQLRDSCEMSCWGKVETLAQVSSSKIMNKNMDAGPRNFLFLVPVPPPTLCNVTFVPLVLICIDASGAVKGLG